MTEELVLQNWMKIADRLTKMLPSRRRLAIAKALQDAYNAGFKDGQTEGEHFERTKGRPGGDGKRH